MKKNKKIMLSVLLLIAVCLRLENCFSYFITNSDINSNIYTKSYNLSLNGNGGQFTKIHDIIVKGNKLQLPIPSKPGYEFISYVDNNLINYDPNSADVNQINKKALMANWNIINYSISYNLNGGTASNLKNNYTIEETFTLPNPTKNGYIFIGWTGTGVSTPTKNLIINNSTGNKSFFANWIPNKYTINVNSIIQNKTYSSGLSGFTFSVWINDILVANKVIDYQNTKVDYGSKVRVYVYDRNGYNITSFKDKTWTVNGNLTVNPTWYDNIPPTITSFSVTNLGYYDPIKGPSAGWNIRVYINGYDEGTGILKYQTWLKPYKNGAGANRVDGNDRTLGNVLYLNTAEGRTFCAYAIDNAGNESERCQTIHV